MQDLTDADGITKQVGCKAFFKAIPVSIPGIGITAGESSSNETTFTVTRYQLYVDGEEMLLVDRLAGIVKIDGTDFMKTTISLL